MQPTQCPKVTIGFIKNQHLKLGEYIETNKILESLLMNCEEEEAKSKLILAIKNGVEDGSFGIGQVIDAKVECQLIKEACYPTLLDSEVIIRPDICKVDTDDGKNYTVSSFKIRSIYLKDMDWIKTKSIFESELKDFNKKMF